MNTLTDADRNRIRKLQDRWLKRNESRLASLAARGLSDPAIEDGGPRISQVRQCLCPEWESWFEAHLDV